MNTNAENIVFRALTPNDTQGCLDVISSAYPEDTEETQNAFHQECVFSQNKHSLTFVCALKDLEIIGFAAYGQSFQTDKIWELAWATVKKNYQGIGIGKKLIDYRIQQIKEHSKTPETFVTVHTKMSRLYQDFGFQESFKTESDQKNLFWKKIS